MGGRKSSSSGKAGHGRFLPPGWGGGRAPASPPQNPAGHRARSWWGHTGTGTGWGGARCPPNLQELPGGSGGPSSVPVPVWAGGEGGAAPRARPPLAPLQPSLFPLLLPLPRPSPRCRQRPQTAAASLRCSLVPPCPRRVPAALGALPGTDTPVPLPGATDDAAAGAGLVPVPVPRTRSGAGSPLSGAVIPRCARG